MAEKFSQIIKKLKSKFYIGIIFLYVFLIAVFSAIVILLHQNTEIQSVTTFRITPYPLEDESESILEASVSDNLLAEHDEEEDVEEDLGEEDIVDERIYIELTPENRANFTAIDSCLIQNNNIGIWAIADAYPKSDDNYYYLFGLNTYEKGISENAEYITSVEKELEVYFDIKLNLRQANSRLFKKFVIAVKLDGIYVPVSSARYITNPEAVAKHGGAFPKAASIKGILVDPNKLHGHELDELGVKQAAYNVFLSRILGQTTNAHYPTIYHEYNGKTYAFNGHVISEYDFVFSTLTAKGITTTAIILNDYSSAYPELIHPKSRGGGSTSPYYAFNAADSAGVDTMAAIGSFLAERYSGSGGHGKVYSWVIANEINARKEWNYMEKIGTRDYAIEYANAFRVFYNSIKSVTANAKVYISLDHQWDRNLANNPNYDARDILDELNKYIKNEGNIDWGLAFHPYSVPLTICQFWAPTKYVNHTSSTPFITMNNLSVLTDYMKQSEMLTADGKVRSINLSEQGYTSHDGEALQAAAFAYAYYIAEKNPYIDAFLLNRQTDAPEEVAHGLAFGLNHYGGGRKQIFDVFKHIDTADHAQFTEFAKAIIGIEHW